MVMLESVEKHIPARWQNPLKRVAYALWGSGAFVALAFLLRGVSGAYRQELSALAACSGASLAAVVGLAALGCYRVAVPGGLTRPQALLALALTVLPVVLLGIVLSPASSAGIAWTTMLGVGLTIGVERVGRPAETFAPAEEPDAAEGASSIALPGAFDEAGLTQWMTRRVLEVDGEAWEQIEGLSTVDFSPGQQHATMHLSICPPLSSTPEIECETPGDEDVQWKVTALHPYGVRLELRRSTPASAPLAVAVTYTMAAQVRAAVAKAA